MRLSPNIWLTFILNLGSWTNRLADIGIRPLSFQETLDVTLQAHP